MQKVKKGKQIFFFSANGKQNGRNKRYRYY